MATFETAILACVIGLIVVIYSKLMLGWIYEYKKKASQDASTELGNALKEVSKMMMQVFDDLSKKEEERKAKMKAEMEEVEI